MPQAVEIIQLRSDLRRVHLHETNQVMLNVFGVTTDAEVEAARDDRIDVRARATDRLLELQQGSGTTAGEALFLYDLITQDGLDGVREADPGVLFDTGRAAARDGRPADEALTQESAALYDLMRTDAAPMQVLNDALDAAYTMDKPEVGELLTEYVSRSEPYILSDGGYLGPDPQAPLVDSYVYDPIADVALAGGAGGQRPTGRERSVDVRPMGAVVAGGGARCTAAHARRARRPRRRGRR